MSDLVHNPPHYTHSEIETLDAIEAWGMNYHLGNAIKYLSRAKHKGSYTQDLEKARFYITRELERAEHRPVVGRARVEVRVGDKVRCIRPDDHDRLSLHAEYQVAQVNNGSDYTFVSLVDMNPRFWDAARFQVVYG